jgi:Cupin domain
MTEQRLTGGTCVNFGCTPSKALIRCARAIHDASRGAEFGFRPMAPRQVPGAGEVLVAVKAAGVGPWDRLVRDWLSAQVDYRPGGFSAPHRHPASGFVFAYVISGTIRSQIEGQPLDVYRAGQSWTEPPKPARLIAYVIADDGAQPTVYDK